jgi:hypothetical protein
VKNALIAVAVLLLAGCSASCPVVTPGKDVVLQKVSVPVEVARVPPADVSGCWNQLPTAPRFEAPADKSDSLVLRGTQIDAYKALISGVQDCDQRWRTWATAAPPAQPAK